MGPPDGAGVVMMLTQPGSDVRHRGRVGLRRTDMARSALDKYEGTAAA